MTDAVKDRDGLRYAVALIEIQGGLVGLWAFLHDLIQTGASVPLTLLPGVLFIGLVLAASVVAGVALWQDRRLGYTLSVPVQLAQVIWFVSAGLTVRISRAAGCSPTCSYVRRPRAGSLWAGSSMPRARAATPSRWRRERISPWR